MDYYNTAKLNRTQTKPSKNVRHEQGGWKEHNEESVNTRIKMMLKDKGKIIRGELDTEKKQDRSGKMYESLMDQFRLS